MCAPGICNCRSKFFTQKKNCNGWKNKCKENTTGKYADYAPYSPFTW